ncbi:putative protein ZNF720 [Suricata suricatta]|uniref:putative protein ZNF720 n=1 Tax=Suricata suricatta TaxID=37032 RepID=UPI0011560945|nr:putative protein ZNF720 [Suricata suricatta]
MLETYGHLTFLGLVVSKPDLVIFLEQKRELWDVKRKDTAASYPAVFPSETDSLLSETFMGTSIQRVSVDGYNGSALENGHLMRDWNKDGDRTMFLDGWRNNIKKLQVDLEKRRKEHIDSPFLVDFMDFYPISSWFLRPILVY